MTLLEMRQEYEHIRGSWRSKPPAEHRFDLSRLQELHVKAEESTEEGTEQLVVEVEDLIAQIGHQAHHPQHAARQAPSYNEPSDSM